jgi:hypothetical protein
MITFAAISLLAASAGAQTPPYLGDDEATGYLDTPVEIDVTANDAGTWVPGSGSHTTPSNGTLSGGEPFVYTPNPGTFGVDSFTYSLTDVGGTELTATVTITILDEAPPVEANDDFAVTPRGTAVIIDVLANDMGNWIAGFLTQPSDGSVEGTGGGMLRYQPDPTFSGTDTFTYTLTAVGGAQYTATVSIDVDSGPLAIDDFAATNIGMPITIDTVANDFGGHASTALTTPVNGSVVHDGAGEVTYTPNAGFSGSDSFEYTTTDTDGAADTGTVTVAVSAVVFVDDTVNAGIFHVQCGAQCAAGGAAALYAMTGGAAAGDYDGDGDPDLYVTRFDAPDILYVNQGNGTFVDGTAGTGLGHGDGANGATWADIDADGDLDLYVTSLMGTRFHLYVNDGGSFTEEALARGAAVDGPDTHVGYSASFGDYDGDGYLDLHTTEWRPDVMNPTAAPSNSRLLRNLGAANPGHFEDVTDFAGVALDDVVGAGAGTYSFASQFTDLDNDGLLDLAVVADGIESRLFWNDGDGTFTDGTIAAQVGTDENGMGNAIGDTDGDGLLDWFVTSIYDPADVCAGGTLCGIGTTGNRLYRNNGDRTFSDDTDAAGVRDGGWGWGASFFDYDNDGDLDIVHTNGIRQHSFPETFGWQFDQMKLFENDGTGTYDQVANDHGIFDTESGKGLLTFDYDLDGDLDVFVVNTWASPVLYRNDGGNGNDWLRVAFDTSEQHIGARVLVEAVDGGPTQLREMSAGSNFLGQNEEVAHFGLGPFAGLVHQVTVTFPSGAVVVFDDVTPNTTLTVTD